MRDTVQVFVQQTREHEPRLLATINSGSKYKSVNVPAVAKSVGWTATNKTDNPLRDARVRRAVAEDIIDGWKRRGPWPHAKFNIVEH